MSLKVRCLLCSKVLQCTREDTSALLEHIREYHPEVTVLESSEALSHMAPEDPQKKEDTVESKPRRGSTEEQRNGRNGNKDNVINDEPKSEPKRGSAGKQRNGQNENRNNVINDDPKSEPRKGSAGEQRKPTQENKDSGNNDEQRRDSGEHRISTDEYNIQRNCRRTGRKRLYKTSIEKWRPGIGLIFCPKCGTKQRPLVKSHTEKISTSTLGAACILTCWPFCFFPCLFPSPTKEYLHCPVCDNFLGVFDKERSCVRPNKQFVESEQEEQPADTDKPPAEGPPEEQTSNEEERKKKKNEKRKSMEEDEFYDANQ